MKRIIKTFHLNAKITKATCSNKRKEVYQKHTLFIKRSAPKRLTIPISLLILPHSLHYRELIKYQKYLPLISRKINLVVNTIRLSRLICRGKIIMHWIRSLYACLRPFVKLCDWKKTLLFGDINGRHLVFAVKSFGIF